MVIPTKKVENDSKKQLKIYKTDSLWREAIDQLSLIIVICHIGPT